MVQTNGNAALSRISSHGVIHVGWCLYYCQDAWESPHAYPTAAAQWAATKQHTDMSSIPHGAPVFWTGGSHGYGHIALWDNVFRAIRSTDAPNTGRVGIVDLSYPARQWGLRLVGWGSSLGGASLPLVGTSPANSSVPPVLTTGPSGWKRPVIRLGNVNDAIRRDRRAPTGSVTHKTDVFYVESALYALGYRGFPVDGSAGTGTFGSGSAYQRWQVRCGMRGAAADGYPPAVLTGHDSMTRLAHRTSMFYPAA